MLYQGCVSSLARDVISIIYLCRYLKKIACIYIYSKKRPLQKNIRPASAQEAGLMYYT